MIGHRMWATLSQLGHDVYGSLRSPAFDSLTKKLIQLPGISEQKIIYNLDAFHMIDIERAIAQLKPDWILNCIGVVKQIENRYSKEEMIYLNALFPHQLASVAKQHHAKLLLFSTDCVFSGNKGCYREDDIPDALDVYGKTKSLGEIADQAHVLTLRTSTIGREVKPHGGLLEWFLSQQGSAIKGYQRAIYSGFPAHTLAKLISKYALSGVHSGIIHLATQRINKYELLGLIKNKLKLEIAIEPDNLTRIERSLHTGTTERLLKSNAPEWKDLLDDLLVDWDTYQLFTTQI